jgi:glycosyltransferase involved in cell wall biosynthesis
MQLEKCWIVSRKLGVTSEIWLYRQVLKFRGFVPEVVCWAYENQRQFPLIGHPLRLIPFDISPADGPARWWIRFRNLRHGNFYGTVGVEADVLRRCLKESRPSVILAHFGYMALRILPVALEAGVPVVVHFHGLDVSSGLRNRWYRWSLKRMFPHFSAMVCVGTGQRKRLIELGADPEKVHLIPCGVPVDRFPLREPLEEGPIRFICVARLVQWKGIHHCIGAFARLASRLPGSELVIAGDGEERKTLEALSEKLGILDRVVFKGSVPEPEVRGLLERSDVFLQHSLNHHSGWFEGFGVSVAEAAAIGLPVVVSACGGLLDQVVDGETGMVVAQRDEEAMADAMLRLAEDRALRERMGRAGRERMVKHFDMVRQVEKLERVLLDAVQDRSVESFHSTTVNPPAPVVYQSI